MLVKSVLIASSAVSWALSLVLVRFRIVAKPHRRKTKGFKPLSVGMDGVASTVEPADESGRWAVEGITLDGFIPGSS